MNMDQLAEEKGEAPDAQGLQIGARIRLLWRQVLFNRFITALVILLSMCYILFALNGHNIERVQKMLSKQWQKVLDVVDPLPSPVDPSTYSPVYPENPDPKLVEIAKTMTELYDLLIEMRYLSAERVNYPPHTTKPISITEMAQWGFTKEVVDLLQMLPYVEDRDPGADWNFGSDAGEFLFWGEFYDIRGNDTDFDHSLIDPMYALGYCPYWDDNSKDAQCPSSWHEKYGYYIRPYYAVLNDCGNHGTVMILNTKDYNIWVVNQMAASGSSEDPAFKHIDSARKETRNENDLRQYPSRPAVEFLRDIIHKFKTLEYIPGGLYGDESYEYSLYKELYLSSGWPDNFDPAKFDIGQQHLEEAERQRRTDEEPLFRLKRLQGDAEFARQKLDKIEEIRDKLSRIADTPFPGREAIVRQLQDLLKWQDTHSLEESQARDREQLQEVEATISSSPTPEDPIERLGKAREELKLRLSDKDYLARTERLVRGARDKADKVDPKVREIYEAHVAKYGR